MLKKLLCTTAPVFLLSLSIFAQTTAEKRPNPRNAEESLDFIATDLKDISRELKSLNKQIVKAYSKLSDSLGLSLTEKQRSFLILFEVLNRCERRLSNLKKMRLDFNEKINTLRLEIGLIETSLRRESIDRSVAFQGTTNANELRERNRRLLTGQKRNLQSQITEIQTEISLTNTEILQTTSLVERIRRTLFPSINQELKKLESEDNDR